MALANVSDAEIRAALDEHGSINKAAQALDVSRSSLQVRVRGFSSASSGVNRSRRPAPTITRESLHAALVPPNTCKVKAFLATLDDESREVVEEGLGYPAKDFSASALREWLLRLGFKEADIPVIGAITDHRNGRRPCRCLG